MPKLSTTKLVDSRVKDLECSTSQKDGSPIPATYWDSEIRGFGVQVLPSGTKTFFFKYKSPVTRKQAWYKLGRYTGPASMAQARKKATAVQLLVDDRKDPKVEEAKAASIPTVAKLVTDFVAGHYSRKAKSTKDAADSLLAIAVAEWGTLQPGNITRPMVQELFEKVSNGWRPGSKEKNPKPTPIQANRLLAYLSKLFNWSEKNDYQPQNTNPCRHIEKNPENKRERYLSDDEIQALHTALDAEEGRGNVHEAAAVRILLYTGARLREVLGLRWDQVELQRDELGKEVIGGTIILREHKTAGKVGTKVLPLNLEAARELGRVANFKLAEGTKLSPFVFPGSKAKSCLPTIQRFWERVRKNAGLSDVHTHDLRHTFAAAAISEGLSLRVSGGLLGHTQAATTQRYAHLAQDAAREATAKVGKRLAKKAQA